MDFLGVLVEVAPEATSGAGLGPVLDHFNNMLAGRAQAGFISSQSLATLSKVSSLCSTHHQVLFVHKLWPLMTWQQHCCRGSERAHVGVQVTSALHSFLGQAMPVPAAPQDAQQEGTAPAVPLVNLRCRPVAGGKSASGAVSGFCRQATTCMSCSNHAPHWLPVSGACQSNLLQLKSGSAAQGRHRGWLPQ